jgi:superfamily II DNA or RNA helicase
MAPQPALKLRDYHEHAIERVADALRSVQAVCLTAPTGSGKTLVAGEIVARAAQRGQHVLLMTNRRILLAKADQALTRHGVFRSRL